MLEAYSWGVYFLLMAMESPPSWTAGMGSGTLTLSTPFGERERRSPSQSPHRENTAARRQNKFVSEESTFM
jgi:hypothetical protein